MARSFVPLRRLAALSVAITLLASSIAVAQTREPTYPTGATTQAAVGGVPTFASQLQGKNVWITAEGARVRGRVTSLSPTSLVLVENGGPTTIPYSQIVRVEKSTHRKRNWLLTGLGVGVVSAAVGGIHCIEGGNHDEAVCGVLIPLGYTFIGIVAGGVTGSAMNAHNRDRDVIYDAKRQTTTVAFAPILSPTRKGVAFSMTWR